MEEVLVCGCNLSPYDVRDYKVAATGEVLPDKFELDFSNIQIKNQTVVSSCVAHAMSTILEYHAKGRNKLSTNFIYGIRKKLFGSEGKGMYLRDACKIVTQYGDMLEEDCPGNIEVPMVYGVAEKALEDEEAVKYAADYKVKAYFTCKTEEDVKTALIQYGPVLASLKWFNDFKVKNGILCGGDGKATGYHAIVVYGYNEDGFLCQNSWGKSWGNGGCFILPYDIKFAETRGLIDLENDEYVSPKKINKILNKILKLVNTIINLFLKR